MAAPKFRDTARKKVINFAMSKYRNETNDSGIPRNITGDWESTTSCPADLASVSRGPREECDQPRCSLKTLTTKPQRWKIEHLARVNTNVQGAYTFICVDPLSWVNGRNVREDRPLHGAWRVGQGLVFDRTISKFGFYYFFWRMLSGRNFMNCL